MKYFLLLVLIGLVFIYQMNADWKPGDDFYDVRDGKTYKTVLIGEQVWFAENINIGDMIVSDSSGSRMKNDSIIEKYCWNNGIDGCDGANGEIKRGGFYEFIEAMQSWNEAPEEFPVAGICPYGWHIPSNAEWNVLFKYINGPNDAAKAKALLKGGSSGFNAELTGWRNCNENTFDNSWSSNEGDTMTYYWTASVAFGASGQYVEIGRNKVKTGNMMLSSGFCVRCIMDGSAADGPMINTINKIDFEEVPIAAKGKYDLMIKNVGLTNLYISGITVEDGGNNVFGYMNPGFPYQIYAGATQTIPITFTPKDIMTYQGTITIISDSEKNPEFKISVTGSGIAKKAQISGQSSVDMGEVIIDSTGTKKYYIKNTGSVDLEITDIILNNNSQNAFAFEKLYFPIKLKPDNEKIVNLSFTPADDIEYSAEMIISSSDETTPEKTVEIYGKGKTPAAINDNPNPNSFNIHVNPNPFTDQTTVLVDLYESDGVNIELYDLQGVLVKSLYSGVLQAGIQTFDINSADLSTGIYILKISNSTMNKFINIIILK